MTSLKVLQTVYGYKTNGCIKVDCIWEPWNEIELQPIFRYSCLHVDELYFLHVHKIRDMHVQLHEQVCEFHLVHVVYILVHNIIEIYYFYIHMYQHVLKCKTADVKWIMNLNIYKINQLGFPLMNISSLLTMEDKFLLWLWHHIQKLWLQWTLKWNRPSLFVSLTFGLWIPFRTNALPNFLFDKATQKPRTSSWGQLCF